MKCPRCRTGIHVLTIEGIDLEICSQCKGLWFDKDELAFMVELTGDDLGLNHPALQTQSTTMPCPRCGEKQSLEAARWDKGPVTVDRCRACHGLWLDRGELGSVEKIAAGLSTVKSKIMLVAKQLTQQGYQILGVR